MACIRSASMPDPVVAWVVANDSGGRSLAMPMRNTPVLATLGGTWLCNDAAGVNGRDTVGPLPPTAPPLSDAEHAAVTAVRESNAAGTAHARQR